MNAQGAGRNPAATALLREAAEWRLIGLLFECPGPDWKEQVAALAAQLSDDTLREAASRGLEQASTGLYHSTFGPGGPAAPREVSCHDSLLPGAMLSEIRGSYDAFAYRPALDEPPDHVAVEAGFVAYLRIKEAYAELRGDATQRSVCADAARWFIETHLAVVAHPLAASLKQSGVEYLALAAEALRSRAGSAPPKPVSLPVAEPEQDEISCSL